jgi:hypothetical protein
MRAYCLPRSFYRDSHAAAASREAKAGTAKSQEFDP